MDSKVVRPCGLMEHFSTSRHALGVNRGIANSCKYVVHKRRLEGRPVQMVVEEAIARLVLRLGGLRVGITGEDTNNACFVRVPSMNLQDFVQWTTIATVGTGEGEEQVLRGIKNTLESLWPDPANRPPWQVLVVENQAPADSDVIELDIAFAVHHALADGKSTTVFHTELLRLLNDPPERPTELNGHELTFTELPVLAPSQEDLVRCRISWSFFLQTLWSQLGPAWLKPTPSLQPWTGTITSLEPQTLNLRLVTIAPRNRLTSHPRLPRSRDDTKRHSPRSDFGLLRSPCPCRCGELFLGPDAHQPPPVGQATARRRDGSKPGADSSHHWHEAGLGRHGCLPTADGVP